MTRNPFDAFSKQLLEELLTPFGQVETSYEVSDEPRLVDLRFIPTPQPNQTQPTSTLLTRIAANPCLLEPFRNPPTATEIRNCLLKLLSVQAEGQRQARRDETRALETELPQLWILAPSTSEALLTGFGASLDPAWLPGIYWFAPLLKTAIVVIHQLPVTDETLWLRLLGRGNVQQQAIREVLTLPSDDERRVPILELLVSWKISLALTAEIEQEEQELMAQLSQAYLDWKQQTEAEGEARGIEQGIEQGERSLILRLLTRKFGTLPDSILVAINALSITQLEALGEVLLDFITLEEVTAWLTNHSV
jgi:hypothetical protein